MVEGECHGYGIKQKIEARTGGALQIGPGTLYEAVHRMLEAGWIEESGSAGEAQRGASRRRIYRLSSPGRRRMEAELGRLAEIVSFAENRGLLPAGRTGR